MLTQMRMFGVVGAVGLLIGVALGAFGAHALRNHLSEQMQAVFETGVRYQMYHSLALLLVAFFADRNVMFQYAGFFYIAGIILFSFSLYALALTQVRGLGMITPFGGLSFLIGHVLLVIGFLRV